MGEEEEEEEEGTSRKVRLYKPDFKIYQLCLFFQCMGFCVV